MAIDSQMFAEINACEYLVVQSISEPRENSLRAVAEEARREAEAISVEIGGALLTDLHRVRSTPECHLYELLWEHYIAYSVTNELFVRAQDLEIYSGRHLRVYSKSHFLEYISKTTNTASENPGPMQHIGLLSENHIIEVASTLEPRITRIR
jgi:hypothetical protein